MATPVNDFSYYLPPERIAQSPANPRESAKLMTVNRITGEITHDHVGSFPRHLRRGDVVVVNNTKVFRARLRGETGGNPVELFLVRPAGMYAWLALAKPGKKCLQGNTINIAQDFHARIEHKNPDGTLIVSFNLPKEAVIQFANIYGSVPVPPYIKTIPNDSEYQTAYAKYVGSVAAPTAGFHITPGILEQMKHMGVTLLEITLHVGLGTFMPMKTDSIETHIMHGEWTDVSSEVADAITAAKKEKRRIIAIGTTTVRTLEGVAAINNGRMAAFQGDITLFITPGFPFCIVDAMLTNFHLPKSTLIVLVSAFAGRHRVLSAYEEAMKHGYRFYSFGDAMFIR